MTVSNDPSLWWAIDYVRQYSYFEVAGLTILVYDSVLTFGQEFELVWRQRWSLMTFLYLSVRYIGIPWNIVVVLQNLPSAPLTDTSCIILFFMQDWVGIILNAILSVIVIVRLYAMYQRSRQMLIFLVVTFLAVQVTCGVLGAIASRGTSQEEDILSGAHMCSYNVQGDTLLLLMVTWALGTAWEILTLCLAAWIAVKHFRELQGPLTRWTVGDSFKVLLKTHLFYFASFVAFSSIELSYLTPQFSQLDLTAKEALVALIRVTQVVQMFILGPRLILGIRERHANLIANADEGIGMVSIVFQERIRISTGSGV